MRLIIHCFMGERRALCASVWLILWEKGGLFAPHSLPLSYPPWCIYASLPYPPWYTLWFIYGTSYAPLVHHMHRWYTLCTAGTPCGIHLWYTPWVYTCGTHPGYTSLYTLLYTLGIPPYVHRCTPWYTSLCGKPLITWVYLPVWQTSHNPGYTSLGVLFSHNPGLYLPVCVIPSYPGIYLPVCERVLLRIVLPVCV